MSTAVFVSFATPVLDLDWIPDAANIIVVHNDASLDRASIRRPDVVHVDAGGNVGFGAAVNLALPHVTTERVVLCNPDVVLTAQHWDVLTEEVRPVDVVTVPLVDGTGVPTSEASRYPTPVSHVASAYRLGRWFPRGSTARVWASRGLGRWGQAHEESLRAAVGAWPLDERWVSGAVFSVDADRLRDVGGFDEQYFLYYEDVDLCRRLARATPGARAVVADVDAGMHAVGASAGSGTGNQRTTERHRFASALRYAEQQRGAMWRVSEQLLRLGRRRDS